MKKIYLSLFFFAFTGFLIAQTPNVCFSGSNSYTVALTNGSEGICNGDFNGDGKMDLATVNTQPNGPYTGNSVSVFMGDGAGNFSTGVIFSTGSFPLALISVDVNNDNHLDLITGNYTSNDISVLIGDGAGNFATAVNFTVGTNPRYITSEDFNGDGKIDLAVDNMNTNDVSILLGDGAGSFNQAVNYTVGTLPFGITNGDFNGDHKIDLATRNQNSNNVSVLIGNGDGTFATAVNYTVNTYSNWSNIISNDINGDANADLLFTNATDGVYVLYGNGNGTFGGLDSIATGSKNNEIIISDFNKDGKIDLVSANSITNEIFILTGNGTGSFSSPVSFPWVYDPNVNFYRVTLAVDDFDGDNMPDIAVNQGKITVLLNKTAFIKATGTFCQGQNVVLKSVKGDVNYSWLPSGSTNDSVLVTSSGAYSCSLTVQDNNCVSICNAFSVTINPSPVITVASATICIGDTAHLTAAGANTYTWSTLQNGISIAVTPTTTTNYTVIGLDANGCKDSATAQVVTNVCTGIDEVLNTNYNINLYPNPNNGIFNLQISEHENMSIEVYSIIGQKVYAESLQNNLQSLNISTLNDGVYFIRVLKNNSVVYQTKICKQ